MTLQSEGTIYLTFTAPYFQLGSARTKSSKASFCSARRVLAALRRRPMATLATDELKTIIADTLDVGKVSNISGSGSSGWASMHRATTEDGTQLFIKLSRQDVSMFEGEAHGLSAMHQTNTIKVPKPYGCGSLKSAKASYIIMESLDLRSAYSQGQLGTMLAKMHLAPPILPEAQQGKFGFSIDNTIGSTPQPNGWMDNWVDFFRERRLRHQLQLAGDAILMEKGSILCRKMHALFEDIKEPIKPSLLHGDFWSGNISGVAGSPATFDPACYYGHHEAEFGMSWCAGLGRGFWDAYHEVIPRQPGFSMRHKLYQLYHYLNHYNLFGGGYYGMSESLLNDLLSELA